MDTEFIASTLPAMLPCNLAKAILTRAAVESPAAFEVRSTRFAPLRPANACNQEVACSRFWAKKKLCSRRVQEILVELA